MHAVFDGHNDVLLRLWRNSKAGADPVAEFRNGTREGHIDGPRARAGGLGGGICAIYIPSGDLILQEPDESGHYNTPLASPLERQPSLDIAMEKAAIALRLDRAGAWRLCRSTADIRKAFAEDIFAAVLHMEGCEAIDADLDALDVFYAAGLRSLGPVWSRANAFATGVQFVFPSSPDIGPGLTDAGVALVQACAEMGILVDLSHLNEKGFWDVARLEPGPLVASHSGAHALAQASRNLTDAQLDAIGASGGLVGIVYATAFLRADFADDPDTPLSLIAEHARHVADRIGVEHVALGSDFDGATIPGPLGDVAGLPKLLDALRAVGFGEDELERIAWSNWRRVLDAWWR